MKTSNLIINESSISLIVFSRFISLSFLICFNFFWVIFCSLVWVFINLIVFIILLRLLRVQFSLGNSGQTLSKFARKTVGRGYQYYKGKHKVQNEQLHEVTCTAFKIKTRHDLKDYRIIAKLAGTWMIDLGNTNQRII